jgi:hypothetical protein
MLIKIKKILLKTTEKYNKTSVTILSLDHTFSSKKKQSEITRNKLSSHNKKTDNTTIVKQHY